MKTFEQLKNEVNAEFASQVAETEMRAAKKDEYLLIAITLVAIGSMALIFLSIF